MRKAPFVVILTLVFVSTFLSGRAQKTTKEDTLKYNPKRLRAILITEAALYGGSVYLLNDLWYKNYPRSSFHFFNDNKEWLQMDKIGHATTSSRIGEFGYKFLRWSGVKNNKAIWFGGSLGFIYLLNIEILDGFSSQWGFSMGDFSANTFGAALFMGQQFAWNEQRIKLKWSYHQTIFSDYRPDLLGKGITETWLKDYNGQTYWLSCNISSFLRKGSRFPAWLNVAVGYGAEGMLGGYSNPETHNGVALPYYERYRQLFLAPDIDFTKIKTRSKFLADVFYALNILKCPAPTLEFSQKKIHFRPLYF